MTAWKQETQLLSTLFTSPCQTSPNSSKSCVLCYPQLESGLEAFGKSFHFPLPTPALPLSCPGLVSYEHTKWSWTGSGQRALLQPPPSSPGWSSSLQELLLGANLFSPWRACPPTVGCLEVGPPYRPWEMANCLTVDLLDTSLTWPQSVRSNDFHCIFETQHSKNRRSFATGVLVHDRKYFKNNQPVTKINCHEEAEIMSHW